MSENSGTVQNPVRSEQANEARITQNDDPGVQDTPPATPLPDATANGNDENARRYRPTAYCKELICFSIAISLVLFVVFFKLYTKAKTPEAVQIYGSLTGMFLGIIFSLFIGIYVYYRRRGFDLCWLWNEFCRRVSSARNNPPYGIVTFNNTPIQNESVEDGIESQASHQNAQENENDLNLCKDAQTVQSTSDEKGRILEPSVSTETCNSKVSEVASAVSMIATQSVAQEELKLPQTEELK